jgi:hypothetical protein
MAVWRDIDACRGTLIRALHVYWTAKRGARAMPTRGDIDPSEIKALLPNLIIVDIEADPFRVRYRLLGTKVVMESGNDFTGRYLDELIAADFDAPWEACYRLTWADRMPVFGDTTVPTRDGGRFSYEFGIFPLGGGGSGVTQCVCVEDYGELNERLFELQERAQPWQPRGMTPRNKGGRK